MQSYLLTIVSVFTVTDLPSAVYLHFGESVLTPLESTTVNCTAVGRSDPYNLTLWKDNRLLVSTPLSHLNMELTDVQ